MLYSRQNVLLKAHSRVPTGFESLESVMEILQLAYLRQHVFLRIGDKQKTHHYRLRRTYLVEGIVVALSHRVRCL